MREQNQEPRFAGEYVLKHNCFHFDPDTGQRHVGGDVVYLDRSEAERIRNVFVPLDSPEAKHLQATTDAERNELRAQELEAEAARLRSLSSDPVDGPDPSAPLAENENRDPLAGHSSRTLESDER